MIKFKGQSSLIEYLLAHKRVSEDKARQLNEDAQKTDLSVDQLLEELKVLPEEEIAQAKSEIYKVPYINLAGLVPSSSLLEILPQGISENYKVAVVGKDGDSFEVAMINPGDFKAREAIDFIARQKKIKFSFYVAAASSLKNIISQYSGSSADELEKTLSEAAQQSEKDFVILGSEKGQTSEEEQGAPVVKLIATFLKYAVDNDASDIHIEPYIGKSRIRFRIDGILYDRFLLPGYLHSAIVSRIKVMSNLRLDETRKPQDGRIRTVVSNKEIDLRVSTLPLLSSEKVTMRVLDPSKMDFTFENLGFEGDSLEKIKRNLEKPHGMFLVTGPTGCGKTTTLYTGMKMLNRPEINMMTLEDPIEYHIEGINQSQVKPEIGYTFANGIRSFVRQDPDVIMVGEIRDNETAELAVQAALTGHLVLSTLHTNSALGAIPRLIDMKIEPFLIASSLNMVLSQRLVRKVCPKCRQEVLFPPEAETKLIETLSKPHLNIDLEKYRDKPTGRLKFFRGTGCAYCRQEGYRGRSAVYEIFEVTPEVAQIITNGADNRKMEEEGRKQKMMTLMENGYLKVLNGATTLEEVLKAAQD